MRFVIEFFNDDMGGKLTYKDSIKAREVFELVRQSEGLEHIQLWKFYPDNSDNSAELLLDWKKYESCSHTSR